MKLGRSNFKCFRTTTSNSVKGSQSHTPINKHSLNETMQLSNELHIIFSPGTRRIDYSQGLLTTMLASPREASVLNVKGVPTIFTSTQSYISMPDQRQRFKCSKTSTSLGLQPTVNRQVWMKSLAKPLLFKLAHISSYDKVGYGIWTSVQFVLPLTSNMMASNGPEEEEVFSSKEFP